MLQLSVISETNESLYRTVQKTIQNETKTSVMSNISMNRSGSLTVKKFVTVGRGKYRVKSEKHSPPEEFDDSLYELNSTNKNEKSSSSNDESIIDITSIPMVPSSTPLRVKHERRSSTANDDQLKNNSPVTKRRSSKRIKIKNERNTGIEMVQSTRPKRKVTPNNLAEPSLSKKMRRPI